VEEKHIRQQHLGEDKSSHYISWIGNIAYDPPSFLMQPYDNTHKNAAH